MTKILQCDLHDYFEIACMFHYKLKLLLNNGDIKNGKANNLITKNKREFIFLEALETRSSSHMIALNEISKMTVLNPNARFIEVRF